MILAESLAKQLSASIDPAAYLSTLGFNAYEWQKMVLTPGIMRLILNCARQSGKSVDVSALVTHQTKYSPGSLVLLFAPTENQAIELMDKISVFMKMDPEIILIRDSTVTKKLLNGSKIIAFSAAPKSARGFSDPDIIVFDEASQTPDELYLTVRPMMTGGKTRLILLSTPFGKQGFFYEIWDKVSTIWTKVLVKPVDIMHEWSPAKYPKINEEKYRLDNAKIGIRAFISPRHTKEWLLEELEEMGEHWFLQEYGCEFRSRLDSVFDEDSFMRCFDDNVPLLDTISLVEVEEEAYF